MKKIIAYNEHRHNGVGRNTSNKHEIHKQYKYLGSLVFHSENRDP